MKHEFFFLILAAMIAGIAIPQYGYASQNDSSSATPGTAFSYQGRLTQSGKPATGSFDFRFILYDASVGGAQVGPVLKSNDLPVRDGYFIALLDFGAGVFNGQARWLEISVRPGASSESYTTLSPRQALTPTPYALYSQAAPWSGLSGVPAGFADGVDNDTTSFWSLTGNSGTDSVTNYIGTNDDTALILRVNGQSALWLSPHPNGPNVVGGYPANMLVGGVYGATLFGGGSYNDLSRSNRVSDIGGTVSGGMGNEAGLTDADASNARFATVSGGYGNLASGGAAIVGGGGDNRASAWFAAVGGGLENTASEMYSYVGGGWGNIASGSSSTVAGGSVNQAGHFASVGGGYGNNASENFATISGGESNTASGQDATVSGGWKNTASGNVGTVGGGYSNMAGTYASVVGGGYGNTANADYATIGGGYTNLAIGTNSTIGGGTGNSTLYTSSTIGGGDGNIVGVDGASGTIGGGWHNFVDGNTATVPGGAENEATGGYSFAAGAQGHATHAGSFVWSSGEHTYSYAERTFTVRAHGGARFYTASGTTTGVVLAAGGGSWSDLSDRNAKENFQAVDPQSLLAQLAQLPIASWNYRAQDDAIRHLGPTAQDFSQLFGLGEDDTHISTVDADGVALAAIQGLYSLSQEQAAQITALSAENKELKAQLDDIEARLASLEGGGGIAGAKITFRNYLPSIGLTALGIAGALIWRRKAGGS